MNIRTKGYIIGAIAAATYGTNPIFAIPLYKNGMDTNSVLFFRYLLAIPIIIVMMKMRGRTFSLKKKEILPVISMGIVMSVSSLALFESYNYIGAGIASTILFVYPILVAIIMALLFHERLGWLGSICIALAIGGIFMLYQTEDGTTLNIKGSLVCIIICFFIRHLSCVRKPFNLKGHGYIETYSICPNIWFVGLLFNF